MTARPHQWSLLEAQTNCREDWQTHPLVVDVKRDCHCHSGQHLLIDPHSERYKAAAVGRLQHRQDQHLKCSTRTEGISSDST